MHVIQKKGVPLQPILKKIACDSGLYRFGNHRDVAQLVAHYVRDVGVGRSSRLIPTKGWVEVADIQWLPFLLITFLITFLLFLNFHTTPKQLSRN